MDTLPGFSAKNGRVEGVFIGVKTVEVLFCEESGKHVYLVFQNAVSVCEHETSYHLASELKTAPAHKGLTKYTFLSTACVLLEIIAENYFVCEQGGASPQLFDMLPESLSE